MFHMAECIKPVHQVEERKWKSVADGPLVSPMSGLKIEKDNAKNKNRPSGS